MPRPKSKDELLTFSTENFHQLLAKIETLEEAARLQPGACHHWSVKDILAHLHHWHTMMLHWYEVGMRGEKPEMPAPGYTWKDTPALNAAIYEQYKDEPYESMLDQVQRSHQALIQLIEGHTDQELFTKRHYPWTGTTSLGSYLVSATSSHYDWALKHVRKFAKGRQSASTTVIRRGAASSA